MENALLMQARDVAIAAAQAAGAVALDYFGARVAAKRKADLSPVTAADVAAEKAAIATIRAAFPTHGLWGEESGRTTAQSSAGDPTWIIDPIDGTKQFMRGIPIFATLVALVWDGQPIVGASFAPALGELLVGVRGMGATFNGTPIHVSDISDVSESYMTFGPVVSGGNAGYVQAIQLLEERALGFRGYGDFYGYHLVARGLADVMIEAQVSPWDVAPLKLIVEEAGGIYSDFTDDRNALGGTSLATNGHLHEEICTLFRTLNVGPA